MLRRIYDWCIDAAHKPYALWIMGAVSFAESSFFPVPPDVMLIPMSLARPERAWLYAGVCTATSVLGGILGYAIAALRTLRRMRPFTAWVTHGGQVHVCRTVHLAVGNGRHYGGGMTIASNARIDDHRLDIFSLEVDSVWRLLRLLPALRSGRHQAWTEIRTLAGQVAEVRTRHSRSVNTDGEIRTRTPVRFEIRQAAVAVLVPDHLQ